MGVSQDSRCWCLRDCQNRQLGLFGPSAAATFCIPMALKYFCAASGSPRLASAWQWYYTLQPTCKVGQGTAATTILRLFGGYMCVSQRYYSTYLQLIMPF